MTAKTQHNVLPIRGICYDTGTNFEKKKLSREVWHGASAKHDMHVIAHDLHCTAVSLLGTDVARLQEAAEYALAEGLDVWIQPRLVDGSKAEVLEHLIQTAKMAEALRQKHSDRLTLNIGCELSVFMKGVLPGPNFMFRMYGLMVYWAIMPLFNWRLNRYLSKASRTVREYFKGPVTYAAGEWESINWDLFDYVGVDYYREKSNNATYIDGLRKYKSYGKPVIITEYGCCAFKGAAEKGGGGFLIIKWGNPPTIKPGYERDEQVQADYIKELFELYEEERIDGGFVYAFSEPTNVYTKDPRTNLDTAGYGIVKIIKPATTTSKEVWEPKEAFTQLAELYKNT